MSILLNKKIQKNVCIKNQVNFTSNYNNKGWTCSYSKEASIDLIIYLGENAKEVGLVIGLSWVNGTKNTFFLFNNFPIFSALLLRPSLVTIPSKIGLFLLKWDFVATNTEVS